MATSNGQAIATAQYTKVSSAKAGLGWSSPATKLGVTYNGKKEKKMGWFKRKFAKWAREAWESSRDEEMVPTRHEGVSGKSSIRFTVYAASGGFIIEHYKQDRYRESDGPELTIVNTGDSLGTAVEHILTMEALKS